MNKIALIFAFLFLLLACTERRYDFEFIEINTPGNASLRAICAVDENIIWTSGSQGTVCLSLDGGENWNQMIIPECEETEFRSMHAWDARRALVFDVSPEGKAFMTTNGGQNWEQVYHNPVEGVFFNSLKFSSEMQGIAISDPIDDQVFVLKTEDGGWNWTRLEHTPLAVNGEINFAASNTCIEYLPSGEMFIVTGGSSSRVLTSHDHGNTWKFMDTPVMTGESAGLFSVNFSSSTSGVAVGGDFNFPYRDGITAIFTDDGGRHWQKAEKMPAAYRSCVVSVTYELFFATGKTGCDYSMDRGRNWVFIDSTGYYAADAVEGENIIYLSGERGRVSKVSIQK